jgi:hypothetical protein
MIKQNFFSIIAEEIIRSKIVIKEKGLLYVMKAAFQMLIINNLSYPYYMILKPKKTFLYNGKRYQYFYNIYKTTWANERTVEMPIILDYLRQDKGKKILEVGNVISHYFEVKYDILDKYEKAKGVINEDVINFKTDKRYDLIISVSTIEHVGMDEIPHSGKKILLAIDNLKNLLKKDGKLIMTLPIGYNPKMDVILKKEDIKFDEIYGLRKYKGNKWRQEDWQKVTDVRYGTLCANAIIVAIIKK